MKKIFTSALGLGVVLGLISLVSLGITVLLLYPYSHSGRPPRALSLLSYSILLFPTQIMSCFFLNSLSKEISYPLFKKFLIISFLWTIEIWILEALLFGFQEYFTRFINEIWYDGGLRHLDIVVVAGIMGGILDLWRKKNNQNESI
ncbi:hypothetical protein EHQ53_03135 [Leptospira langatensis]|uniref:Uncharacterized protein n=1 Tax=Leptospira langatensis TaxID=2484983 RepID=A0A5F2A043_9LEPT|nr:hypothetical protein [Leptospira langatensis]TGK04157.1 hypothetical protein EHO57_03365 [Leptospira langatensis]TGL43637.1 hypothetical protein EHQ53_03135 [Leptospira langatensis]